MIDSLNAVRSVIKETYPDIERIYLHTMPVEFDRPSFLVRLISTSEQYLSRNRINVRHTWQIVYFSPINMLDQPSVIDQLSVSSALKHAFLSRAAIRAPDSDVIFHVLDCSTGSRDNEVYANVRVETEVILPDETLPTMQSLNVRMTEGG